MGSLQLNTSNQQIKVNGELLSLPARETAVLSVLMMQKDQVISKDKIAKHLSFYGDVLADNAIEIYIHRLRKRIEPYGVSIRTFRGLGYLLERQSDE
jgi:two-component system OmpR family response regulator